MRDIVGNTILLEDTVAFALKDNLVLGVVVRLFPADNIVIIYVDDELYERKANRVVKIKLGGIRNDIRANESNYRQYTNIFPRIYRESCTYYHAR